MKHLVFGAEDWKPRRGSGAQIFSDAHAMNVAGAITRKPLVERSCYNVPANEHIHLMISGLRGVCIKGQDETWCYLSDAIYTKSWIR